MSLFLHFLQVFKGRRNRSFLLLAVVLLANQIVLTTCEYKTPIFRTTDEPSQSSSLYGCGERCGSFQIPFPFYVDRSKSNFTSCKWPGLLSDAFHLSCINSSSLFLNIASQSYRVLHFFQDALLVDFPNTSFCRRYNGFKSFPFAGNEYFGISTDNVVALYDCEDSSLCKTDCQRSLMPACDDHEDEYPACCYPLSDRSAWQAGESDGFSVFSQFGCRGFSSWVVLPGSRAGKRGVKLEWAIPRNSTGATCASNADAINATAVSSGMRCQCHDGFLGDGFASGVGCLSSCLDGKEAPGKDCYTKKHPTKIKAEILAGVLASAFIVASLLALFCLLKRPMKSDGTFEPDQNCCQSTISFRKACQTRLFTYHELEEATRGFEDEQKLTDSIRATLYAGVLVEGSRIAVHRVQCESERETVQVLSRVEALAAVSHKNMARLLGWSIDSGYTLLVVYELPANGTLEEQLHQSRDQKIGLIDWFKRLNIIAETASFLAFLECEFSPPIFHYDLQSGCIFLDGEYSVKISGFQLLNSNLIEDCHPHNNSDGSYSKWNDVYNLGLVILEVITGSKSLDLPTTALQKIRNGTLEEIVDPLLYYHEQPAYRREQIEIVADIATRCLLFGADGKLGMVDVARELVHITKGSVDGSSRRGPALEETFSNSSLLQMISTSPDSLYEPQMPCRANL